MSPGSQMIGVDLPMGGCEEDEVFCNSCDIKPEEPNVKVLLTVRIGSRSVTGLGLGWWLRLDQPNILKSGAVAEDEEVERLFRFF